MTRSTPLILVVEDNIDNRLLVHDMLDLLHYDVVEAVDGAQGVELASLHLPTLILMDLSLPLKSGWDAAHACRVVTGRPRKMPRARSRRTRRPLVSRLSR